MVIRPVMVGPIVRCRCRKSIAAALTLGRTAPIMSNPSTGRSAAALAQLDRASVYGTEGWWFEPTRLHSIQTTPAPRVSSPARVRQGGPEAPGKTVVTVFDRTLRPSRAQAQQPAAQIPLASPVVMRPACSRRGRRAGPRPRRARGRPIPGPPRGPDRPRTVWTGIDAGARKSCNSTYSGPASRPAPGMTAAGPTGGEVQHRLQMHVPGQCPGPADAPRRHGRSEAYSAAA